MHFARIAFSQRCISRRFAFFAICISAQSQFSDYPAGRQIARVSGEARSGCRHDAKRRGGRAFDREVQVGVPISLAVAFRLERRWALLKLIGITSSKKGDVRLLRLAAAPRVVVVMDLLGMELIVAPFELVRWAISIGFGIALLGFWLWLGSMITQATLYAFFSPSLAVELSWKRTEGDDFAFLTDPHAYISCFLSLVYIYIGGALWRSMDGMTLISLAYWAIPIIGCKRFFSHHEKTLDYYREKYGKN